MRKITAVTLCLFFVCTLCLVSVHTLAEGWRVSIGPVYRGGMEAEIGGSSYVQELGLHAAEASGRSGAVGGENSYADRDYSDGFVYIDVNTLNDGLTWFWRWEDAGQWDAGDQTLTFHGGGHGTRVRRETLLDQCMSDDEDVDGAGLAVMAAYALPGPKSLAEKGVQVEVCIGAQGVWNSEANFGGTTYRERLIRERYRVTDVYDVGYDLATTVAFPPPWEGDFGGPNPLIDNMPSDRKRKVTARTTWEAENRVDVDVESDLYELWFGPRLAMLLWKKISAYFIPSISATRVEMDAKRTEEFVAVYSDGRTQTLSRWEDDECEGEWLFGAGVQAGAEVDLGSGWFAGIFGGYDWVDEVEMDIGPNTVTLDPSGYTVGIEIGKKI